MCQLAVEVSEDPEEITAKLTPGEIDPEGADRVPGVPPNVLAETRMTELAVTALVATAIAPDVIAAVVPIEALDPVLMTSLLPAVARITFPDTVVLPPIDGVEVKAGLAPVAPAKMLPVAPTLKGVTAEVPDPTRTPWFVKVIAPVPPLATDTGALMEMVAVEPEPVVKIPEPCDRLILPLDGVTVVESLVVNVFKEPAAWAKNVQLAVMVPPALVNEVRLYSVFASMLIQRLPIG